MKPLSLYWCWVIVLTGCALSIYYAEILMMEPCRMCWYQRVALFPMALILGIGLYRNDSSSIRYALPLCVFGGVAAFAQTLGVHFPSLQFCGKECAKPVFQIFGWISFPDLSFAGFFLVGISLFSHLVSKRKHPG